MKPLPLFVVKSGQHSNHGSQQGHCGLETGIVLRSSQCHSTLGGFLVPCFPAGLESLGESTGELGHAHIGWPTAAAVRCLAGVVGAAFGIQLQMLALRLPDSTDVEPEALSNTIREDLAALELQIETLDPGARIPHEFNGQRNLNLRATGPSSAQFAAIAALLKAPPERQLQTLTLTHAKTEAPSVLRLQIQMHLYDNAAP